MKKMTIIGAGISGLTAGIHALKKGYEVTIFEKNAFPGGCATGWMRNGYYIDNCMHWLTGTNQSTKTFKMWKAIGAIDETTNLHQGEFFYKTIDGASSIALYKDLEKTKEEMIKISVKDIKEINCFIKSVKYLVNIQQKSGIKNNHLFMLYAYSKYKKLSLEGLSKRFKHPLLKKLFIDFFPKDYSALSLIYAYSTFASGNGKVLKDGSCEFSNNIVKKYTDLGGIINYKSEVTSLEVSGKKITSIKINNNQTYKVDKLIYAGDPEYLFSKLLDNKYNDNSLYKELSNIKSLSTMSSFHVAFLVDKSVDLIKDTTIFDIDKIKIGAQDINRLVIKSYSYLYDNKNKVVYQSFTPQFKEDYAYFEKLKNSDPELYKSSKEEISLKIKQAIIKKYPNLNNKIEIIDTWTPLTYNDFYHTYYGSYMGFILTPKKLFKKFPNKIKNINNLAIASYWNHTMGGLPVALKAGINAVKAFK